MKKRIVLVLYFILFSLSSCSKSCKYNSWSLLLEPTLNSAGKISRECEIHTDHTEILDLPIINNADYKEEIIKKATCESFGLSKFTYKIDGQSFAFIIETPYYHAEKVYLYNNDYHYDYCLKCTKSFNYSNHDMVNGYCNCGYHESMQYLSVYDTYYINECIGVRYKDFESLQIVIPNFWENQYVYSFGGILNANELLNVEIPDNILVIEDNAFYNCEKLESVVIGKNVEYIKGNLFSNCPNIKNIDVSEDNDVFDSRNDCNAIIHTNTGVLLAGCNTTIIPDDIVSISYNAFDSAKLIEYIEIPASVTHIHESAFLNCDNLKYLYYKGTQDEWNKVNYVSNGLTVYFYSESEPFSNGNYWHYDENKKPIKW
ncbi:MAG: leucine-rich repeat domain-containing protein [Bacilli bacterium]|nr:leucine-rich repeat domain-containing protein [Bacilli bacterium]